MDSTFALRLVCGYHVAVAISRLPDSTLLVMPAVTPLLFPECERPHMAACYIISHSHSLPNTVQSLLWAPVPCQGHRGLNAGRVFCCSHRCSYWSCWHFLLWYLVSVKILLQVLLFEFSKRPHIQELNTWEKNSVALGIIFNLFLKGYTAIFLLLGVHLMSRLTHFLLYLNKILR